MFSKVDLYHWQAACHAFDNQNYIKALDSLLICHPSSKTYFNIGVILITLHDYQHALNGFAKAIEHDPYFSAAYFQSGVSNIMLGNFGSAVKCFDLAHKTLRGNKAINYRQLGLEFTLYACEILYNRGMCQIYLDNAASGMEDLRKAQQLKMNKRHTAIDHATNDTERSTFGVYSIPTGIIYRPRAYQLQLLNEIDASSSSLHYYYSLMSQEPIFSDKHHHEAQGNPSYLYQQQKDTLHYYRHVPKYVSKYLSAVITKDKINVATSKPIPSIITSQYQLAPPAPSSSLSSPLQLHLQQYKGITIQQNKLHGVGSSRLNHDGSQSGHKRDLNCCIPCNGGDKKIKLKIYYKDTHILMVNSNISVDDLQIKVQKKLDVDYDQENTLKLHYKNDGGALTQIVDNEDWSLAKSLYLSFSVGKCKPITSSKNTGKIEIWCTDMNKD